jgi:hypothetical protein
MKSLTIYSICLCIIVFNLTSNGQGNSSFGIGLQHAKIITRLNTNYEVNDLTFFKDSVSYLNRSSNNSEKKHLSEIYMIQRYTGNYSIISSLVGVLVGGAIGVIVDLKKERSYDYLTNSVQIKYDGTFTLVGLVVGGVIGFIYGLNIKEWETVYASGLSLLDHVPIKICEYRNHNGSGISLHYYFLNK